MLFLKGMLIGIGKIIPGVSGAMLAINFGIYEKIIDIITSFSKDIKNNIIYLLILGMGIISSIVGFSNVVIYFLNNYRFATLMLFCGLIVGGTFKFSKKITYNVNVILLIIIVIFIFTFLEIKNVNTRYIFKNNYIDYLIFFIGGGIESFSSIVPGISGTSLLMMLGIYDNVLYMISQVFNFRYVFSYIGIYISYILGIILMAIFLIYLVKFLFNKYKNISYSVILGLSISSIIFLILLIFNTSFSLYEFILGATLLFLGEILGFVLDN